MREIKFRYVYKHKKTGEIKSEIYTLDDIQGYEDDNAGEWLAWREWDIIAREQCTGLKDLMDKDVFDGDRIRYFTPGGGKAIVEVTWSQENAAYAAGLIMLDEALEEYCGEIIGNIHEKEEIPY